MVRLIDQSNTQLQLEITTIDDTLLMMVQQNEMLLSKSPVSPKSGYDAQK
jgi:hypothetical protein